MRNKLEYNEMKINKVYMKIGNSTIENNNNIKLIKNLISMRPEGYPYLEVIFDLYNGIDETLMPSIIDLTLNYIKKIDSDKIVYSVIQNPYYMNTKIFGILKSMKSNYKIAGIYDANPLSNVFDDYKFIKRKIDSIQYKQIYLPLSYNTIMNIFSIWSNINKDFKNISIDYGYDYCKNINFNIEDRNKFSKVMSDITDISDKDSFYAKNKMELLQTIFKDISEDEYKCSAFKSMLIANSDGNILSCVGCQSIILGSSSDDFSYLVNQYKNINKNSCDTNCRYEPICKNCYTSDCCSRVVIMDYIVRLLYSIKSSNSKVNLDL